MSAGEVIARKPVQTRDSAVATMRTTMADFRRLDEAWARDVESLFDEFETTVVQLMIDSQQANSNSASQTPEQWNTLLAQQQALTQQQQSSAAELANVRQLVERQMELMAALSEQASQIQSAPPAPALPTPSIEQWTSLADQQQALVGQQQTSTAELAQIRRLVEVQAERIAALAEQSSNIQAELTSDQSTSLTFEKLGQLAERQHASATELTSVRQLIERQGQCIAALSDQEPASDPAEAIAQWRLQSEHQLRELMDRQAVIAEQQKSGIEELGHVRRMVEQQAQRMADLAKHPEAPPVDRVLAQWQSESMQQLRELVERQDSLAQRHESGIAELTSVRRLIEQQSQWIVSLSEKPASSPPDNRIDEWQSRSIAQLQEIIGRQEALAEQQHSNKAEMSQLRKTVEKQLQLISEFSEQSTTKEVAEASAAWQVQSTQRFDALAQRQDALARQQQSNLDELAHLRKLVEQQVVLIRELSEQSGQLFAESTSKDWQSQSVEQLRVIAAQQKAIVDQQKASVAELSNVRQIVQKQTEWSARFTELSEQLRSLSANEGQASVSSERLEALTVQQQSILKQQQSSMSELANMRKLIEKQIELVAEYSDLSDRIFALSSNENRQTSSEEQLGAVARRQEALSEQQRASAGELVALRRLVEQQMELMMAFLDASSQGNSLSGNVKSPGTAAKRDPVVDAVKAQFEKLKSH